MLSYNLPNYLAMDTAIFQAINTFVLGIKVIVCSPVNSAMVQKTMIVQKSALAQKQHFLFSILPQTYVSSRKLRVLTQKSHLKVRGKFEDT